MSRGRGGEMPRGGVIPDTGSTDTSGCDPGVRRGRPWATWGSFSDQGRVLHPAGPAVTARGTARNHVEGVGRSWSQA